MTAMVDAPSNSRWWESYLVRYFFGWIVGSACVLVMASRIKSYESKAVGLTLSFDAIGDVIGGFNDSKYIALILLGFVFCYFSSMPIAVMHFGRYGKSGIEYFTRYFWLGLVLSFLVEMIDSYFFGGLIEIGYCEFTSSLLLFLFLCCSYDFSKNNVRVGCCFCRFERLIFSCNLNWLCFHKVGMTFCFFIFIAFASGTFLGDHGYYSLAAFPALWIMFFQFVICFRIWGDQSKIATFYATLAKSRLQEGAYDIRDTYTHLREHSNAIFIVIIELSLTAVFLCVYNPNIEVGQIKEIPSYIFGFFFAWLIPSLFLWSAANRLEDDFRKNPIKFIK